MATIIGIHGLSNKPEETLLADWWEAAIREGLRRNKNINDAQFNFESVYWADVLYPAGHDEDPEPYPYDDGQPKDGALKVYKESWLDEIRADVLSPIGKAIEFAKEKFGMTHAADAVLEHKMKDLWRYYDEDDIQSTLRQKLTSALAPALAGDDDVMLISHSMGTIIAHDVLQVLSAAGADHRLDHWITIGSPLGLPHVIFRQEEEFGNPRTPNIVEKWTNFADKRDPVALDVHLADDYGPNENGVSVKDDLVINDYGGIRHKSYGYLRAPEVTEAIAAII